MFDSARMKIYTKAGDQGMTSGLDQKPVSKNDLRIHSIGSIDELNSAFGVIRAHLADTSLSRKLDLIQNDLFSIGSYLSSENDSFISQLDVGKLETQIDKWTTELPPLRNFILPGGAVAAAHTHVARSVARRAERSLVALHKTHTVHPAVIQYLNRLSDWLFTLARYINLQLGSNETLWKRDENN